MWVYVAALIAILVAQGMNLYGLRANAGMLAVQVVVTGEGQAPVATDAVKAIPQAGRRAVQTARPW